MNASSTNARVEQPPAVRLAVLLLFAYGALSLGGLAWTIARDGAMHWYIVLTVVSEALGVLIAAVGFVAMLLNTDAHDWPLVLDTMRRSSVALGVPIVVVFLLLRAQSRRAFELNSRVHR